MRKNRWEECVVHYNKDVILFFNKYFTEDDKSCLIIGGAGFDPRSSDFIKNLSKILEERLTAYLIKEERPDPDPELVKRADNNLLIMQGFCQNINVTSIDIFAEDNAVVGGHNAITSISELQFSKFTDVIIDMSALSVGISFPIVSYIYKVALEAKNTINVHLVVLSNPGLDALISSTPNDRVSDVRGFNRGKLFGDTETARLWLPQLSEDIQHVLSMIHSEVAPHDTCPILPFPSEDPKKGDRIVQGLISNLENEWNVDPRNFVYADERKPLDIYRTILQIDEERKPVFEIFGGSIIILSPLASKIPSIGALMAALEYNFPVVYVETLSYNVDWIQAKNINSSDSRMAHVWLYGDAYLRDIEAGLAEGKNGKI